MPGKCHIDASDSISPHGTSRRSHPVACENPPHPTQRTACCGGLYRWHAQDCMHTPCRWAKRATDERGVGLEQASTPCAWALTSRRSPGTWRRSCSTRAGPWLPLPASWVRSSHCSRGSTSHVQPILSRLHPTAPSPTDPAPCILHHTSMSSPRSYHHKPRPRVTESRDANRDVGFGCLVRAAQEILNPDVFFYEAATKVRARAVCLPHPSRRAR